MTVRKRTWTRKSDNTKQTRWMIDINYTHPDGRTERIRETAPGTSKREALEYERQVLRALMEGKYNTYTPEAIPTLEEFCQEWLRDHVQVECKPSTARGYQSSARAWLVPSLGEHKLDKLDARILNRFKATMLKSKLSKKTINNHLGALSSMLAYAVELELLDKLPPIKWYKIAQPEIEFWEFDQIDRVLEAVEDKWRVMVTCGYKTGMRLGELCALRISNVDLIRAQIYVCEAATRGQVTTPKGGRSRTIPIPNDLVEQLEPHIRRQKLKGKLVFSQADGGLLTHAHVKRVIPRACRKAGLQDKRGWHTLRHTYASHLVMLGTPLKVVQELLGHATLEMTMRYAHLAPDVKQHAVTLLDSRDTFSGTYMAHKNASTSK